VPGAQRRGLVVARRPSSFRRHLIAQTEQALWQEFCDHGTSLKRALNEALQIHGGPAWRVFQVCDFSLGFAVFPPSFLPHLHFP
jgi:hypothetical protein